MKTEIHRLVAGAHTIVTRTKGKVVWESVDLKTGDRKARITHTQSTPQSFESDMTANSKPTHPRCAVLILERK